MTPKTWKLIRYFPIQHRYHEDISMAFKKKNLSTKFVFDINSLVQDCREVLQPCTKLLISNTNFVNNKIFWTLSAKTAMKYLNLKNRLGVPVPLRSRHFLSQKLWLFHKNIHSCVENECCFPCTVNISNVSFTSNIYLIFWRTIYLKSISLD